jgi:hypothetical protein
MTAKPKSQVQKFRDAARADTHDSEQQFNAAVGKVAKPTAACVCPECGHVFQGKGCDGIDAHWRACHEGVMPYEEAWPLIQAGRYQPKA